MKININAIRNVSSVKSIEIESDKRVFVVGDLDANFNQFHKALQRVGFNSEDDILISLGDIIDRGKDSIRLFSYFQEVSALMVLGNHEHIMLESLVAGDEEAKQLWLQNGGDWHLNESSNTLNEFCQWLLKQPLSLKLKYNDHSIGLSHTLPVDWNWNALPSNKAEVVHALLWDRERFRKQKHVGNHGVDFSIHGHNQTQIPIWIANTYHIDTSFYGRPTLVELSGLINDLKQRA